MSNYLTRLVARTLAPVALRPRARLRFEDAPALQALPEETPVSTAPRGTRDDRAALVATSPRSTNAAEPTASFRAADRRETGAASVAPRREPPVHGDESRPAVALELPRASSDDAPMPKHPEGIRAEAPPHRVAAPASPPETIVETRETVRVECEAVAVHDERVVQTSDRAERVPARPPSSPPQSGGTPVRAVTTRRVTTRTMTPQPQPHPQPAEPIVHVSIGRIEVRATTQAAAPRRREPAPALTLDAYLARRNGKSGR